MDSDRAKTELLTSHFRFALDQLCGHYAEAGDIDGLLDIQRTAEAAVDVARARIRPAMRYGAPSFLTVRMPTE